MPDRLALARQSRGAVGQVSLVLLLADRQAEVGPRVQAVSAFAALGGEQRDDVIAHRHGAHPLTSRLHHAGALVPEHGRGVARGVGPRGGVHVGVADAARDEPDEHLTRARPREVELLHDQRAVELLEHGGAHLHELILPPPRRRRVRTAASGRAPP